MAVIVADISKYQNQVSSNPVVYKPIDFATMECQVAAVIIRMGYGLTLDPCFLTNYAGASRLFRGTYQYFLAGENAIEQAKFHLKYASPPEEHEYPPCIDLEWSSKYDGAKNRPGANYLTQVTDYLKVLEDAGHRPVIYSRYTHILQYLPKPEAGTKAYDLWATLSNYRLWLAQYAKDARITLAGPNVPRPWVSYWMWQTSADGNGLGHSYGVHSDSIDINIQPC